VFSTPDRVSARIEALRTDRRLAVPQGRPLTTYVSLCSGIEGTTAALQRIGSDVVALAFAETDAAANSVLRHHFPDVPRVGDVTAFDWTCLRGHVDLVTFGAPCQAFSIMGRRLGVSDPRGNVALHCIRAIGVMQPRWVLFENVPNLLYSNGGNDFEACLAAFSDIGYAVAWRVLDARHFGLAQRRRRLWLVAERGRCADGPAEILALRDGEKGSPASGGTLWQTPALRAEGRDGELAAYEAEVDWSDYASWTNPSDPALPDSCTVTGHPPDTVLAVDLRHCTVSADTTMTLRRGGESGCSLHSVPSLVLCGPDGVQVRRCTPLECLRLQGFDDTWLDGVTLGGKPLSDSATYALIGNSWPVPVSAWLLERLLSRMRAAGTGKSGAVTAKRKLRHPDSGMAPERR
jgi:DNA (cytosine-5)-methyltransferase 1